MPTPKHSIERHPDGLFTVVDPDGSRTEGLDWEQASLHVLDATSEHEALYRPDGSVDADFVESMEGQLRKYVVPESLDVADDRLRHVAQSLGAQSTDAEAFESAVQACDYVRLACRAEDAGYWLSKAERAAAAAVTADPVWEPFLVEVSAVRQRHGAAVSEVARGA